MRHARAAADTRDADADRARHTTRRRRRERRCLSARIQREFAQRLAGRRRLRSGGSTGLPADDLWISNAGARVGQVRAVRVAAETRGGGRQTVGDLPRFTPTQEPKQGQGVV